MDCLKLTYYQTTELKKIGCKKVLTSVKTKNKVRSHHTFGFNGQEKDNDVANGIYTAKFWEYDSRIARRWNLDPKPTIGISDYSVMAGNPILNSDVDGDEPTDWVKDKKGNVKWDKNATSQATTKAGEKYLGKTFKTKDANYYKDGSAFFTNETKAYKYMWGSSNSDKGEKSDTEHFAWLTKGGVAVLPASGKTNSGKSYNNDFNTSNPWTYPTSGQGSNFTVTFQGAKLKVIGSAHTHPATFFDAPHSGADMNFIRTTGIVGFVISTRDVYGASPTRNGTGIVGSTNDLLKGSFLLIPNINLVK